jgi:hypothetical protein
MTDPKNIDLEELDRRITAIEQRNRRVEADKAWETSIYRKISLILLTYFVMCVVFWSLGSQPYWKNAIVPTLGFYLSTLSLSMIKSWYQRKIPALKKRDICN